MQRYFWTFPILLAAFLLGGALLSACGNGGDERDDVRKTVEDFVTALDDRDNRIYDLLSTESQQQVSKEDLAAGFASFEGVTFRLERISDDDIALNDAQDEAAVDATVTVSLDDAEQQIPTVFMLRKEDGRWRFVPEDTQEEPVPGGEGGQPTPTPAPTQPTPTG